MWRATNLGPVKIEIHPDDPNYSVGLYYIGVMGSNKKGESSFAVSVRLAKALPILLLNGVEREDAARKCALQSADNGANGE